MNEENVGTNEISETNENTEEYSGMSNGGAMLIGGLITAAGIAGFKKVWADHKAKKEEAKKLVDVEAKDVVVADDSKKKTKNK